MSGIYIGPYVRVTVPVIKTPFNEPWCDNCNKRRGDTNFCQDCGKPIVLREYPVKAPSPHWTLPATVVLSFATIDGSLTHDKQIDYIYTIGNGRSDFNKQQNDEEKLKSFWYGSHWDRRGAEDFQNIICREEIAWLKARCKQEIENLREIFGEKNVNFGWGLVMGWR